MYRYALIDESGFILHTISSDEPVEDAPSLVGAKIPDGLIRPKWTGKRWSEGASDEERGGVLLQERVAGLVELGRVAEETREQVSPAGPHALAVRSQKLREARSLLQGCCSEEPFILELEGKAIGVDIKTMAARVLEEHKAWCLAMGSIEAALRRYTEAVREQESRAKLEAVVTEGVAAIRAAGWTLRNPGTTREVEVIGEPTQETGALATATAIKDAKPVETDTSSREAVSLSETPLTVSKLSATKTDGSGG